MKIELSDLSKFSNVCNLYNNNYSHQTLVFKLKIDGIET